MAWTKLPVQTDDSLVVRASRVEQNSALARRDVAAAAKYWARDITVRAGLGSSLEGRDAYTAAFAADPTITFERVPSEISVSAQWPLAFESGTWTGRRDGDGADAPSVSGKYSAQWQKVGDQWLIRSEVFVALQCNGPACQWSVAVP